MATSPDEWRRVLHGTVVNAGGRRSSRPDELALAVQRRKRHSAPAQYVHIGRQRGWQHQPRRAVLTATALRREQALLWRRRAGDTGAVVFASPLWLSRYSADAFGLSNMQAATLTFAIRQGRQRIAWLGGQAHL